MGPGRGGAEELGDWGEETKADLGGTQPQLKATVWGSGSGLRRRG